MIKKFNGGRLALLCENCYVIICQGNNIPDNLNENKCYFCSEKCKHDYNIKNLTENE